MYALFSFTYESGAILSVHEWCVYVQKDYCFCNYNEYVAFWILAFKLNVYTNLSIGEDANAFSNIVLFKCSKSHQYFSIAFLILCANFCNNKKTIFQSIIKYSQKVYITTLKAASKLSQWII